MSYGWIIRIKQTILRIISISKILITDEAIEKVPLIRYKEIQESEYLMLQELAKEVLTISKNDNQSNEVALTYSLDYRNLITTSLECIVIVLHNHPSLSKFSLEDVKFFLNNGTVKMMVVVTNLGSISYLVKKDRYQRKKAVELYNRAVSLHNEGNSIHDYQKAVTYFLSNCHDADIVYEDR